MENLHEGARWLFRVRAYFTLLVLTPLFSFWIFGAAIMVMMQTWNFAILIIPLLIGLVLFFVISEIYARLAYKNWKFELTDSSLRLERGIIWKRYSNVPYERVQNVDIYRGILARMIGFSTLDIQTAGYHYGGRGGMSEGHIPAVSEKKAEEMRAFLMKKIGKRQGL